MVTKKTVVAEAPPEAPEAEKPKEAKRLYRSAKDKMIAGVCGGIAEYMNIDPVWVRLVAVLLLFADGIGLLLYIVAWVLMPVNPSQEKTSESAAEKVVEKMKTKADAAGSDRTIAVGFFLILLGLAFLLKNIFSWFRIDYVWPLMIIGLGAYLVMKR